MIDEPTLNLVSARIVTRLEQVKAQQEIAAIDSRRDWSRDLQAQSILLRELLDDIRAIREGLQ